MERVDEPQPGVSRLPEPLLSRRSLLRRTTKSAVLALAGSGAFALGAKSPAETREEGMAPGGDPGSPVGRDPQPVNALRGVLDALARFPVVAVGEHHLLQEWHDFITALLFHPDLPGKITDVVVEFGNAQHQKVADRFILEDKPVANAELEQIWRHTIGGGVLWDAPVYGQFFRTVRAVNWMQPPAKRVRVLLGDPAFDHRKVQSAADKGYLAKVFAERDPHFAALVEREVLGKGRRALLLAGTGHLLHGVKNDRTGKPNAVSLLDQQHPGQLFVICPVIPPPRAPQETKQPPREQALLSWPRPALAALPGTWLGATPGPLSRRALNPDAARFGDQADAALYLGPYEVLTASRAEPALYQGGAYAEELQRQNALAAKLGLRRQDGLKNALAGPQYFQK
jgi:hypothetical protein